VTNIRSTSRLERPAHDVRSVEKVIQACELERVEVWLLADFLKYIRNCLDDLEGRPMLVFRLHARGSLAELAKQVLDSREPRCCSRFFSDAVGKWRCSLSDSGPVLFGNNVPGLTDNHSRC